MDPKPKFTPYTTEKTERFRNYVKEIRRAAMGIDKKNNDPELAELDKLQKEISDFAAHLRKKYPNYHKYSMYHVLTGSTVSTDSVDHDDFVDDDSVEKFIEKLKEERLEPTQTVS